MREWISDVLGEGVSSLAGFEKGGYARNALVLTKSFFIAAAAWLCVIGGWYG